MNAVSNGNITYNQVTKTKEKPTAVAKSPMNGAPSKPGADAVTSSLPVNQEAQNRNLYRNMILRNLFESERGHLRELNQLLDSYLKPLRADAILTVEDCGFLVGNLEQILQFQSSFFKTLEENVKPKNRRRIYAIGVNFENVIENILRKSSRRVEALNRNRDVLTTFMQKHGSDLMSLITGLSRPFRHLEKYPAILQELERNTEESHPDRGDTQRSIAVYRDIARFCTDTRKQKEMQLELLAGMISGWEGEPISSMGEIIYMGTVQVACDDGEKEDCCLVLLTSVLLVLQISFQLNTYVFKREIRLVGACIRKVTELTLGNGLTFNHVLDLQPKSTTNQNSKSIVTLYSSGEELNKWLELFQSVDGVTLDDSCVTISPTTPLHYSTVQSNASPLMKPQVSTLPAPGHAEFLKNKNSGALTTSWRNNGENENFQSPPSLSTDDSKSTQKCCVRPLPPQRANNPVANSSSGKTNVKLRKKEMTGQVFDQEETELLQIVESYCISEKTRPAIVRRNFDSPHLIVAEDEKIFVEEMVGDEVVVQERTLVDTVYTLKDQVSSLREEVKNLARLLESEQKSRRRIEELVRKHILVTTQRNSASASSTNVFSKLQSNENGFAAVASSTPVSEDGAAISKRNS